MVAGGWCSTGTLTGDGTDQCYHSLSQYTIQDVTSTSACTGPFIEIDLNSTNYSTTYVEIPDPDAEEPVEHVWSPAPEYYAPPHIPQNASPPDRPRRPSRCRDPPGRAVRSAALGSAQGGFTTRG